MSSADFWQRRVKDGAVLSPIDRISEVLFGLIMVLTFTGAISVAQDGRDEVRELLWAALGCNVAWGIVDAIMYWMNVLMERGHGLKALVQIRKANSKEQERSILREELPPVVASLVSDEEVDRMNDRLKALPEPEKGHLLTFMDVRAGFQIFMLVFLCTLPVALPFAFISNLALAMRVSNGVALVMLFIGGYRLAMYAGFRPWITASAYALIGILLVAMTMALGG